MTRPPLEHVIRAAATIAGDSEIVVIGSQAILGRHPDAPPELLVSADVDLYPRNHPEKADLIEGSIGELSPFHEIDCARRRSTRTTASGYGGRSKGMARLAPPEAEAGDP